MNTIERVHKYGPGVLAETNDKYKDWQKKIKQYRTMAHEDSCYGTRKVQLIGLAGPKGVGKTTFAHEVLGGKVFSLATPLKRLLSTIVPKIFIYEEKEAPIPGWPDGITGRYLLQRVGTECFREMWEDVWVFHLMEQIESTTGLCVVDDVRFPNEAEYIRSRGGVIWRLHREGIEPTGEHSSEKPLPDDLVNREITL